MSRENAQSVKILGFGKRLREAFSFEKNVEIADKLGVSEGAMVNYMKDRVPQLPILLKIPTLTGCSLDWLLLEKSVKKEFDISIFGGRYKFNEDEIKAIEQIAEARHQKFDEAVVSLTRGYLINAGLVANENDGELAILINSATEQRKEVLNDIKLITTLLKKSEVKEQILKNLEEDIRRIFQEELAKISETAKISSFDEFDEVTKEYVETELESDRNRKAG